MSTPYEAILAAGDWPNDPDFGTGDKARYTREGFDRALVYLATAPATCRVHSHELTKLVNGVTVGAARSFNGTSRAGVEAAALSSNPGCGFKATPGTVRAQVVRDDGETVWADVGGVWLTKL